jgi:hypothetical protein
MSTSHSGRFRVGRMWLTLVSDDRSKPPRNQTTRVFGERVRNRRSELGLSQEAAAILCVRELVMSHKPNNGSAITFPAW